MSKQGKNKKKKSGLPELPADVEVVNLSIIPLREVDADTRFIADQLADGLAGGVKGRIRTRPDGILITNNSTKPDWLR